jgi:16S rRNA processing protein RimM
LLLVVGRIGRAHGVRGEVTVEVRTDSPEQRFEVGTQLLTDPQAHGPLTIKSARNHSGTLVLSFAEASDRNEVEKLRNTLLLADVDPEDANTTPDDFHISQIVGSSIIDENGSKRGVVIDVLSLPAQDTLVVDINGKEILIPFVKAYAPHVDVALREIHVLNIDGLL